MKFILSILLFLYFSKVSASTTEQGAWLGTFTKSSITEKYNLWAETQMRYNLSNGEMEQTLYRVGPLRSYDYWGEFGLLYGFMQSKGSKEHRFTIQNIYKYNYFTNYIVSTRARYEHRILEDNDDSSQRARLLLRLSRNNYVVWNEVFYHLAQTSWTQKGIDRNRLFIGLNKPLGQTNLEYGYLNQYVEGQTGNTNQHLLVVYLNM